MQSAAGKVWAHRDWLLVVAFLVFAINDAWGRPVSPPGYSGRVDVNLLGTVLLVLAPLGRRHRPTLFLVVVTAATTLLWTQSRGTGQLPGPAFAALLAASYTVGAHVSMPAAVGQYAVAAAAWAGLDLIDSRAGLAPVHTDVGFYLLTTLAFLAGLGAAQLRARERLLAQALGELERERHSRELLVVAEERRRLARDVHDILTHTMSAVAVQAAAARTQVHADPDRAEAGLRTVESVARESLTELRRLVSALRADDGPETVLPLPGIADIERLVAPLEATGAKTTVLVHLDGAQLSPGIELAAYRVVQEAVTNTLKHGNASTAAIRVGIRTGSLEIEVVDDGSGHATEGQTPWTQGHGLAGLVERVQLYRGRLDAGPLSAGGWRVRAELPLS